MAGKKRANGESSIYQRPDGRWVAQVQVGWFAGKRQRKYIYGQTRKEVAQKLVRVQRDLQQGLAPVSERVTVAEWVTHWLAVAVKPPARRLNTYLGYEVRARNDILPYLGHHRLARLQPHDVEKWLQALREREYTPRRRGTAPEDRRYEPRTIQYAHAVLRAALGHAVRQGVLHRNVAKLVDGVRVERPEIEPLEPEAVGQLLEVARGDAMEALYVLAVATGLRRGELLGLRWDDVDLDHAELHVLAQVQHGARADLKRVKGRRIIPLAPMAVEALQRHRVGLLERRLQAGPAWKEQNLVFPSLVGTPLNPANLWRHTRALLKRAGIAHHRMHLYRHTFASLHPAAGADLHEVSKLLGHSGYQITADIYGHLTRQARQTAAERIEKALRSAQ